MVIHLRCPFIIINNLTFYRSPSFCRFSLNVLWFCPGSSASSLNMHLRPIGDTNLFVGVWVWVVAGFRVWVNFGAGIRVHIAVKVPQTLYIQQKCYVALCLQPLAGFGLVFLMKWILCWTCNTFLEGRKNNTECRWHHKHGDGSFRRLHFLTHVVRLWSSLCGWRHSDVQNCHKIQDL